MATEAKINPITRLTTHGVVPGGGLSLDGQRWVACRPGFFLPVRVLSRLFRRLFLEELCDAHRAGKLQFFGEHQVLVEAKMFSDWLEPLRQIDSGSRRSSAVSSTIELVSVAAIYLILANVS